MAVQVNCRILETEMLSSTAHRLVIDAKEIARHVVPGQFLHIGCGESRILRRPISICDVSGTQLTMVFEVRGTGTKWLAQQGIGRNLDVLGPLGRGFDCGGKRIIVVGGGIGVPPLLYAAKSATGDVTAVLGFRDAGKVMLEDAFTAVCSAVEVTTDDGSYGECGFVTAPLERHLVAGGYDAVLACGPKGMLKNIAAVCARYRVPCQVSLEERMGCGVGACLVCACKTKEKDGEHMRRVCKDGPVFNASEVVW
jgi:dihydroorotate dehydrogenase electron transfer subunit